MSGAAKQKWRRRRYERRDGDENKGEKLKKKRKCSHMLLGDITWRESHPERRRKAGTGG